VRRQPEGGIPPRQKTNKKTQKIKKSREKFHKKIFTNKKKALKI
jgi:hypothetical protein